MTSHASVVDPHIGVQLFADDSILVPFYQPHNPASTRRNIKAILTLKRHRDVVLTS